MVMSTNEESSHICPESTADSTEDEEMLAEQLEEYSEMLRELGNHPDKVQINTLSMVADDHASSKHAAKVLHDCIRSLLISPSVAYDRKLPLIYVLDSILKNVGKEYISIVEADAPTWIPLVHASFVKSAPALNLKLRKVLNTWKDFGIFKPEAVQRMIQSFQEADAVSTVEKVKKSTNGLLENISPQLKISMQSVLDDIHSDVDELDKVSLERLETIDPSLLGEIKKAALEMMSKEGKNGSNDKASRAFNFDVSMSNDEAEIEYPRESSLFSNRTSEEYRKRSQDWMNIGFTKNQCRDLVSSLQLSVRTGPAGLDDASPVSISQPNIGLYAAASSIANHVSLMLQLLQGLEEKKDDINQPFRLPLMGGSMSALNENMRVNPLNQSSNIKQQQFISKVDITLFTTAGIMKMKHHGTVGSLYDQGLPFVSAADGRRFATQIELSNHLDAFFRKSQLEKNMERIERGWNMSSSRWSLTESESGTKNDSGLSDKAGGDTDSSDAFQTLCVPADESRSRCAICGNNFEMYFDQEVGDHMYSACREIEVLNDDAAEKESESMLVHVRCLQGLGSPNVLSADQVLQS